MTILGVLLGLAIGMIGAAAWVLIVNEQWHRRAQKLNREWSEFCKKQNEEWLAVSLSVVRATSSRAGDPS